MEGRGKDLKKYKGRICLMIMTVLLVFGLTSCGKFTSKEVVLPQADDLRKVKLELYVKGDIVKSVEKESGISDFLEKLKETDRYTNKESVSDEPVNVNKFMKVQFYHKETMDSPSIIYLYSKNGKKYMEQPYEGIWEINGKTYGKVWETIQNENKG